MKNGLDLLREVVTERYEGESIWDYAWIPLAAVTMFVLSILGSVV